MMQTMNTKITNEEWKEPEDAKPMYPTVGWMESKFDEFNTRFFDGKLPNVECRVCKLKARTLGNFSFNLKIIVNRRTRMPILEPYQTERGLPGNDLTIFIPRITLNGGMQRSEHFLEQTLLHEMCHWAADYFNVRWGLGFPRQGHGPEFYNWGRQVEAKSNGDYTISKTTDVSKEENFVRDEDLEKRLHKKEIANFGIATFKYNGSKMFVVTFLGSLTKVAREIDYFIDKYPDKYSELKICDDGEFGKKIKDMHNFQASRKYTGSFSYSRFPDVASELDANTSKFEDLY